jgi:hypothetical protein
MQIDTILLTKYIAHSRVDGFKAQPLGYWTTNNMRLFLENFARDRNLDPLLPETWYEIPYKEICEVVCLSCSTWFFPFS